MVKYKKQAVRPTSKKESKSPAKYEPSKTEPLEKDGPKPRFIFATEALEGYKYLHPSLRSVIVFDGKVDGEEMIFTAYDLLGDIVTYPCRRHIPIRVDDARVPGMMADYEKRHAFLERKINPEGTQTVETVNEAGETVVTKKPRKARANRGPVNDKTGYGEGTDGNKFALIILKHGMSPDKRKICVAEMQKILAERFDEKKSKALAQSWYSTVKRKWLALGRWKE